MRPWVYCAHLDYTTGKAVNVRNAVRPEKKVTTGARTATRVRGAAQPVKKGTNGTAANAQYAVKPEMPYTTGARTARSARGAAQQHSSVTNGTAANVYIAARSGMSATSGKGPNAPSVARPRKAKAVTAP